MARWSTERTRRLTGRAGLGGSTLIALGALLASLVYQGRVGERYSLLNHFVSELGEIGVSRWAPLFNGCLLVGGLLLTVFMLGVARLVGGRFGVLFGLCGLVTGLSGALVGVLPMNVLEPHFRAAMTFFDMGLVTMALFSAYVLLAKRSPFPRWFVIPGALTTVCFFALLFLIEPMEPGAGLLEVTERLSAGRPTLWPAALIEWLVIILVLVWAQVVSLFLLGRSRMH